jgi:hypothetical protein
MRDIRLQNFWSWIGNRKKIDKNLMTPDLLSDLHLISVEGSTSFGSLLPKPMHR